MTNDEKQLLLMDICMRLPYKVKVKYVPIPPIIVLNFKRWFYLTSCDLNSSLGIGDYQTDIRANIEEVRPFLRPLSSMTEEEKLKLVTLYLARDGRCRKDLRIKETELFLDNCWYVQITYNDENGEEVTSTVYIGRGSYIEEIDWLNKHHFDYRGLIKKGLAIEVKEGMYDIK